MEVSEMDVLKFIEQVEGLALKIEALKHQAAQLVATHDTLSIADRQQLYSVLNVVNKRETFERDLANLRQLINS